MAISSNASFITILPRTRSYYPCFSSYPLRHIKLSPNATLSQYSSFCHPLKNVPGSRSVQPHPLPGLVTVPLLRCDLAGPGSQHCHSLRVGRVAPLQDKVSIQPEHITGAGSQAARFKQKHRHPFRSRGPQCWAVGIGLGLRSEKGNVGCAKSPETHPEVWQRRTGVRKSRWEPVHPGQP